MKVAGMSKTILVSVLMSAALVFVACSPVINRDAKVISSQEMTQETLKSNAAGVYLSGRVAHIRKDFDKAADYYKMALEDNKDNKMMANQLYLLLASQGRIGEAAVYAKQILKDKPDNILANMVMAVSSMYDGKYQQAIEYMNKINDPLYESFVGPMFNAWGYAGLNKLEKSSEELKKIKKEESLHTVYLMQKAMIDDYMGKNKEAKKGYEAILSDEKSELSLRMLDIITNFYIRNKEKNVAVALMDKTVNNKALDSLLAILRDKVNKADENNTPPVISAPRVGAAEALFALVSSLKYADAIDAAHVYTAMTIYLDPYYSTAKIMMADIYEAREMYANANKIYDSIDKNDVAYYPAQIKKARNLVKMNDYEGAEILLKSLSEDYPDAQVYMELGDILRLSERYNEAVVFYDKAIKLTDNNATLWVLYYAKGIALERIGKWQKAEEALMNAYKIKKHYLVLNYIGYTWLRQNHNIEKAFEYIVDAYNQAPMDPSINDSLGFALYNLGYYTMALPYLERAVELYPSSAIISSHLGDVYWAMGRKNEARFQWAHALSLKDDSGELDKDETNDKINKGKIKIPELEYDKEKVTAMIKKIRKIKLDIE